MSKEQYVSKLQNLLPVGQAWTREDGATLTLVLGFIASELSKIDQRSLALLDEADPRSTSELLNEWEQVAGLPDDCSIIIGTIQERRMALTQKVTGRGGQSKAYYRSVAEDLGYVVQFTENRPLVCGHSECGIGQITEGQDIINMGTTDMPDIRFFWSVLVIGPRVTWFRCSASECGVDTLLTIARAEDLECKLNKLKPAHTELIFSYEGI